MADNVSASFSIDIKPDEGDAKHHASIEQAKKLNFDRTQFEPGDTIYWYVYASQQVRLLAPIVSQGTMRQVDSQIIERTQMLQFNYPRDYQQALQKPAQRLLMSRWHGSPLGTPTLDDDGINISIPRNADYKKYKNDNEIPIEKVGVLEIKYSVNALIYELTVPNEVNGMRQFEIAGVIPGVVEDA